MRLKEIRKRKKLTQVKVAIDLNMSQNTVSRYENGEREPGITELVKFADYYGVSVDYILNRTNNPEVNK
ncbi:MAG: helix-turn-helix transcriptional regulator [Clostridia bacterium]|nr:helix-turn-helix transcriptional regulator [Clostridia bacterium]